MFQLQNTPTQAHRLLGLRLRGLPIESGAAKFDLSVSALQADDGLTVVFQYDLDLFAPARIERMAVHFATLLEAIVADPDRRLSQLGLLTDAERRELVVARNDTAASYPSERCIHELFEAQAAGTPDAVAVVCGEAQLTYAELNARANQLAHHLRDRGVVGASLASVLVLLDLLLFWHDRRPAARHLVSLLSQW